jgi:hypothetical protein
MRTTDYTDLINQGKRIVALTRLAQRYTTTVRHTMLNQGTSPRDIPDKTVMQIGTYEFLKAVDRHYTINLDMLDEQTCTDERLCSLINEALEHSASTGKFKEKWIPYWVRGVP